MIMSDQEDNKDTTTMMTEIEHTPSPHDAYEGHGGRTNGGRAEGGRTTPTRSPSQGHSEQLIDAEMSLLDEEAKLEIQRIKLQHSQRRVDLLKAHGFDTTEENDDRKTLSYGYSRSYSTPLDAGRPDRLSFHGISQVRNQSYDSYAMNDVLKSCIVYLQWRSIEILAVC